MTDPTGGDSRPDEQKTPPLPPSFPPTQPEATQSSASEAPAAPGVPGVPPAPAGPPSPSYGSPSAPPAAPSYGQPAAPAGPPSYGSPSTPPAPQTQPYGQPSGSGSTPPPPAGPGSSTYGQPSGSGSTPPPPAGPGSNPYSPPPASGSTPPPAAGPGSNPYSPPPASGSTPPPPAGPGNNPYGPPPASGSNPPYGQQPPASGTTPPPPAYQPGGFGGGQTPPPPGPGYPGGGGPGYPGQPPQNPGDFPGKTLGIVGLIVAIFFNVIGLIISIIARNQSKRAGYKNGPATAGIVVGAVLTGIGVIVAIISIIFAVVIGATTTAVINEGIDDFNSATSSPFDEGDSTDPGDVDETQVDVFSIQVGDCLNDESTGTEVSDVPLVNCTDPHDYEVYYDFEIPGGSTYPGDDAVSQAAEDGCSTAFDTFVGIAYADSTLDYNYYTPTSTSWEDADDRLVSCVIYDPAGKVSGTLEGSRR